MENAVSTERDNEYISLVSKKYKLDEATLAAVYTVPNKGTNFVLQFKKTDGEVKRTPKMLSCVYRVDLNGKISKTCGRMSGIGNEKCSAPEGVMVFNLVKKVLMPQHPEVFSLENREEA